MNATNRQGTFWVIDGVRVKKKQPYLVKQVQRTLQISPPKLQKDQDIPILLNEQQSMNAEEKNFFTEKSYEDFADKRMDYGMIRFSSLSSMRGEGFSWGLNHESNLAGHGSYDNMKDVAKRSIFQNQFCIFQYMEEGAEDQSDNIMKQ